MTKKHVISLAAAIYEITSPLEARAMADAVIRVSQELNPRFDKARFLASCNLSEFPDKEKPCT